MSKVVFLYFLQEDSESKSSSSPFTINLYEKVRGERNGSNVSAIEIPKPLK